MRPLIVPAADLLFGARCVACGGPALSLCWRCGDAIRPEPQVAWPRPVPELLERSPSVIPMAAGVNAGILRRVLIAWKEEGSTRLTAVLDHHLAAAVIPHVRPDRPVALVPVPTSPRSKRARGGDVVDELAHSAAKLLRGLGIDARVVRAVTYARTTKDQAELGAEERWRNLNGAFRLRSVRGLRGRDGVVVDDIVTTGATVVEVVRVLTSARQRPIGVAVVAATARHSKGWI